MPTPRPPVESARSALANARRTLVDRLYDFELAREVLREAQRLETDPDAAQQAFTAAENAFKAARDAEAQRFAELQTAISNWLPFNTNHEQAAAEDIARLEATSPIVLLPVRLETRFEGAVLKVRVFPDEIFLNAHERALTVEERDAAIKYYSELNAKNNEMQVWRDIVARFGVQRSAYILREMLPVFGDAVPGTQWFASSFTCGGTIFGGRNEDLFFPEDIQLRSAAWTRPGEGVLPDRWAFVTYRGGTRTVTLGSPIVEPLAMTPDPKLQETDLTTLPGADYKMDDRLRWSVDFARAVAVGMAVELGDAAGGFDRLIVVGVKSSINPRDTSRHLEELLDAHHYTRGLAIVRQGSPTNNTEGQTTPYPPRDPAGQFSYPIERTRAPLNRYFSHHCLPPDSDGHHLAVALGVPSGVMANIDRAYQLEIRKARKMAQVIWPGTLGYFMRQMMAPAFSGGASIFSNEQIKDTRSYFEKYVTARGPAPAFRVGETPYGVLPIGALKLWQTRPITSPLTDEESRSNVLEGKLLEPLKGLLDLWKEGIPKVPRIRPGQSNPDLDVAVVLSTYPSARQFRVRTGVGSPVLWLVHHFLGWDVNGLFSHLEQHSSDTYGLVGHPEWRPRIGMTLFSQQAATFTGDVVAAEVSESLQLPLPNFIAGIMQAPIQVLNENSTVNGKPSTPNLLYSVLRHSTLTEYVRAYHDDFHTTPIAWIDLEIFGIPSIPIPAPLPPLYSLTPNQLAASHISALNELAFESTAELERLFTETLDVTSHRLDAWISAFATRRLLAMRSEQVRVNLMPKGDFLGGYGWLEDVRPTTRGTQDVPGVGTVEVQPGNGGFIHAPSMTHASAAAVLRNGHLSFKGDNAAAYAIDLSSRRVRDGRRLFEGVRNGQPLGALLGYELERRLHEVHQGVTGIDALRFALRNVYPLVANKAGEDPGASAEVIAARNVVDGSLLLRAHDADDIPYGSQGLPAPGTALHGILDNELDRLNELYDATADLLTAEGVFQLVRGNTDAAVPTIRNVVDGLQPPDTVISRSSRGGTGLAHRVALVFPSNANPQLPSGWPATPTPRAEAEPVLNGWLGQLIGPAAAVTAVLTYRDANGNIITSTHDPGGGPVVAQNVTVRLSDLGLHPLDVLALAEAVAQENQGSVLDRRIIAAALADPARDPDSTPARFELSYTVAQGRSFPSILEVLNTASAVLGASRPLEIRDLLSPAEADDVTAEEVATDAVKARARELYERATRAVGELNSRLGGLQAAVGFQAGVADALAQVASYATQAFPQPLLDDAALLDGARAVIKELERRVAGLPAELDPDTASYEQLLADANAIFKLVFGPSFLALPLVDPPRAEEIVRSLEARSTLLDNAGNDPDKDLEPDKYLHKLMRSRTRLGRFRKLNLYARSANVTRPRVEVVQLPHLPGERWLGLPFDPQTPPDEGRSALLLLHYASGLDATEAWTGVLLDTWSEIIPNAKEETGIAFHYDSPRSQAPQAVLVAVPSQSGAFWSFEQLLASLEQTMDMMKIRAVDQELLNLGQALPTAVFATNPQSGNTVSTTLGALAQGVDVLGLEDG
jgi:hypothetical protein